MKALEVQEQSTDSTLQNSMGSYLGKKISDVHIKAVLKAISEHLLHQKAVLLPDICHLYLQAFGITHYGI